MPLLFVKAVGSFLMPLGMALVLLLLAAALVLFGRRRLGAIAIVAVVACLWALSTQPVAHAVLSILEDRYPPTPIAKSPDANAILLLGGGVSPAVPPRLWSDLGGAGDRVLHASRLYRAGKAPLVLVSAGAVEWNPTQQSAAKASADLLVEWGVPRDAILLEDRARTTRENCVLSKPILEQHHVRSVLLVTSALHMRRALATCRTAGIPAIPSPTDFEATDTPLQSLMDLRPDTTSLDQSSRAIWEILGFYYYRARGWIRPGWERMAPAS